MWGRLLQKICPFCGGKIRVEAIKCRHCGAFLENVQTQKQPCWICLILGVWLLVLLAWVVVFILTSGWG